MASVVQKTIPKTIFIILLLLLTAFSHVFAQNVAMSTEIFRLEQPFTGPAGERFSRFMDLSRIYYLSGNVELALRALERALAVFPNDELANIQQTRFLIALGEYERATVVVNRLMNMNLTGDMLRQTHLLDAQLKAFHLSDFRSLAALASDNNYSANRSAIYYTLWQLQGDTSWRNRLNMEYRQSPEARILSSSIADSSINPAPTPHWLLFPGRQSIGQSPGSQRIANPAPAPAPIRVAPAPAAEPRPSASAASSPNTGPMLQAGLFGSEDNARNLADRIRRAGFPADVTRRLVNGNNFWAVLVPGGSDSNATIRRLRDAGFESFPIVNN